MADKPHFQMRHPKYKSERMQGIHYYPLPGWDCIAHRCQQNCPHRRRYRRVHRGTHLGQSSGHIAYTDSPRPPFDPLHRSNQAHSFVRKYYLGHSYCIRHLHIADLADTVCRLDYMSGMLSSLDHRAARGGIVQCRSHPVRTDRSVRQLDSRLGPHHILNCPDKAGIDYPCRWVVMLDSCYLLDSLRN
jgi:hypothetical protein